MSSIDDRDAACSRSVLTILAFIRNTLSLHNERTCPVLLIVDNDQSVSVPYPTILDSWIHDGSMITCRGDGLLRDDFGERSTDRKYRLTT